MTSSVVRRQQTLSREERAASKHQKPCLLWFTGLSGAGKSTLANALDVELFQMGYHTFILDGDHIRQGLNKDLGFSNSDRVENIRRIGEVSKLFTDAGLIVLSAFIAPFSSDRLMVRNLFPAGEFIEVFVSTPLGVCEQRDPKGLYKRARAGQIPNFTGIDSPYEIPHNPEISIDTSGIEVIECTGRIIDYLRRRKLVA